MEEADQLDRVRLLERVDFSVSSKQQVKQVKSRDTDDKIRQQEEKILQVSDLQLNYNRINSLGDGGVAANSSSSLGRINSRPS